MACDLRSSFLFTQPIKFSKIPTISFYAQFLSCRCLASTSKSSSPIRRRRGKYGTSRKSINRKTYMQEQVEFTSPVPEDPVVGIIGGGVSGLMCASALQKHGIRCSIFDTVSNKLNSASLRVRMTKWEFCLFCRVCMDWADDWEPELAIILVNVWCLITRLNSSQ